MADAATVPILGEDERRRRRREDGILIVLICWCCLGAVAIAVIAAVAFSGGGAAPTPAPTPPTLAPPTPGPPSTGSPTMAPPTATPPTPEPTIMTPAGACCCVGCTVNACFDEVATYQECLEMCSPPVKRSVHKRTCEATWSPGATCAECECPSPTDCCPADPFVYEGSPYASAEPTLCGGFDYDCSGEEDELPCCYSDKPAPNGVDDRVIYLAETCDASNGEPLSSEPDETCGACTGDEVVPGWACTAALRRKRFVPPCPEACPGGIPQEVTALTPPDVGECALFVDGCIPPSGGDKEQCCLVVAQ